MYTLYTFIIEYSMNLARHFVIAFTVLANFYSKDFSLGTLYISVAAFFGRITSKSKASTYSAIPAYKQDTSLFEGLEPSKIFITEKIYYPI